MRKALAVLVSLVPLCAQSPAGATRQTLAQTLAAERSQAGGKPSAAPALLLDHGGPVLSSSKTFAIYWGQTGDFPVDLVTGMQSLFEGFVGSSYLGIAQ